jgi:hypothetical protein
MHIQITVVLALRKWHNTKEQETADTCWVNVTYLLLTTPLLSVLSTCDLHVYPTHTNSC